MNRNDPNIILLEVTVKQLGELADELVFVGGCAASLLVTDPVAPVCRPTIDVDVLTEATTKSEYYVVCRKLKALGFVEDVSSGAPICRYTNENIVIDLMAPDPDVLGFANKWYRHVVSNAEKFVLPSGSEIFAVTGPLFLATKIEAYKDRGNGDFSASHDIEDLITVLDGRKEIEEEIGDAAPEVSDFLRSTIKMFLEDKDFRNSLPGHLVGDIGYEHRAQNVLDRMGRIVNGTNAGLGDTPG